MADQSHAVRLSRSLDHVLVYRNPKAGPGPSADRVTRLIEVLRAKHWRCEQVSDLSVLAEVAHDLSAQGRLRTVVAAGGDGTAELVTNLTPAGTPLSVFPLGTENLLAKYLAASSDPVAAARAIDDGRIVRLDTGELRTAAQPPRLFLLMLGCGFDAEVIRRLHTTRVGHITHMSYAKPILDAIRTYDYPRLNVTFSRQDDGTQQQHHVAHWAFLFNTPSYASGLGICPDADPFDGMLDLITFHGGSFWHGLAHLGNVLLGRHRRQRSVQTARVRHVQVVAERPVPIQVDGDPGGMLPIDVRVLAGRLTAVVPEEWTNRRSVG